MRERVRTRRCKRGCEGAGANAEVVRARVRGRGCEHRCEGGGVQRREAAPPKSYRCEGEGAQRCEAAPPKSCIPRSEKMTITSAVRITRLLICGRDLAKVRQTL